MSGTTLRPIQSVLCAVDLSNMTSHVLMAAAEVAQANDASLTVLHAVEIWDSRYDFMVSDLARRIELEAATKVNAELAHLNKDKPVKVDVQVVKGHGHVKIMEAVKTLRPDLVVIGSHGRRGIDRVLLGSVADRVLRESPTSVLVVRPLRNPDIHTIVCAVDLSEASRGALERAIDLAKRDKANTVKVVHVFEIPLVYIEAGLAYEAAYDKVKSVHEDELKKFVAPYAGSGVKIEYALEEGAPGPTVIAYAERQGADLLVIGAHGRSRIAAFLLGGISTKIVHRASMPVLAVKAGDDALWKALG